MPAQRSRPSLIDRNLRGGALFQLFFVDIEWAGKPSEKLEREAAGPAGEGTRLAGRLGGLCLPLLLAAFLLSSPAPAYAESAEGRFGRVEAGDLALFKQFNERIGASRCNCLQGRAPMTLHEEAAGKLDIVTKQVEGILEMWPEPFRVTLRLLPSSAAVQQEYRRIYHRRSSFIAFFSPRENAIFISVPDLTRGVLAHEMAHAVMQAYFGVAPSVKIHEVLAQMVETEMAGGGEQGESLCRIVAAFKGHS